MGSQAKAKNPRIVYDDSASWLEIETRPRVKCYRENEPKILFEDATRL